jgi:cell division protein FtsB
VMTITGNTSKIVNTSGLTQLCLAPIGVNPPCFGRVGIERTNPSYTLDVNGLIRAQTTIYSSDARFKENIQPIKNGLDVINRLNGTTYTFRQDMEGEGYSFANGIYGGFIAQEVEKVLPQIVYNDEQGYKGLDYVGVIPYLVEGVKEIANQNQVLQSQNASLDAKIADLQAQIDALRDGAASGKGAAGSLDGASLPAELFQNVPNPFNGVTEIRFNLPETVRAASLLVFDMNGKQLRSYDVAERGLGNVRIAANELSSGMYLYTLLADGKEVGTRRMIITE